MANSTLTAKESEAFASLWQAGATCDEIRKCLPRLAKTSELGIRQRARHAGMEFYRADFGEQSRDPSRINESLLATLLDPKHKPRRV